MKALFVAPSFDQASEVSFKWYRDALREIRQKSSWSIEALPKEMVTRENFERKIADVDIFAYWDHGNYDKLADQNKDNLVDCNNSHLLSGKEVFTLACMSSKKLGRDAVDKGAKLYQGYREPFVFALPPFDKIFEIPANSGIIARVDNDIEQSERIQRKTFLKMLMALLPVSPLWLYAVFLAWDFAILEWLKNG